jgi:dTDP-4-dehydrorhamnose reductase
MSNVLIVGAGYVGKAIISWVDTDKHNYHIISRKQLDYSDQSLFRKFILNHNIQYVVNCSGFTGRPNVDEGESRKKECWDLNVVIPLNISNTCKQLDVKYIHISSGCIYSGYEKVWTEQDEPNFGLFDEASTYSKSKHAFETLNDYGCIIRVRMPFCDDYNPRSYLTKIHKYDQLINFKNSKTYIPDLCAFVEYLIDNKVDLSKVNTINFVNPSALNTMQVTDLMTTYGLENPKWAYVDPKLLNMAAPRSNCVLSINKLKCLFPDFNIQTEKQALDKALVNIKID